MEQIEIASISLIAQKIKNLKQLELDQKKNIDYYNVHPSPRVPSSQQFSFKLTQTLIQSQNHLRSPQAIDGKKLCSNQNLPVNNISLVISPTKSLKLKSSPNENQFLYQQCIKSPNKDKISLNYTISLEQIEETENGFGYQQYCYQNQHASYQNFYGNNELGFCHNQRQNSNSYYHQNQEQQYSSQTSKQQLSQLNIKINPCQLNLQYHQDQSQRDQRQLNQSLQNRDICILKDLNSQSSNEEINKENIQFQYQKILHDHLKSSLSQNCQKNIIEIKKQDNQFRISSNTKPINRHKYSSSAQFQEKNNEISSLNIKNQNKAHSSYQKSKSPIIFTHNRSKKKFSDQEIQLLVTKRKNNNEKLMIDRKKINSLFSSDIKTKEQKFQDYVLNTKLGLLGQQSNQALLYKDKVKPELKNLLTDSIQIKNKNNRKNQPIICNKNSPKFLRIKQKIDYAKVKGFKKQVNNKVYEQNANQSYADASKKCSSSQVEVINSQQSKLIKVFGKQIKLQTKLTSSTLNSEKKVKRSQTERIDNKYHLLNRVKRIYTGKILNKQANEQNFLKKREEASPFYEQDYINEKCNVTVNYNKNSNSCKNVRDSNDNIKNKKGYKIQTKKADITKKRIISCYGRQSHSSQKKHIVNPNDNAKVRNQTKSIFDDNIYVTLKKAQLRDMIKLNALLETKEKIYQG